MLDLQQLALRLEEALEKETTESLNAWFASKKMEDLESYVGEGDIVLIPELREVVEKLSIPSKTAAISCGGQKYDVVEFDNCYVKFAA